MPPEQIFKFQPDRTMYLRGFTGFGAAGSLCQATSSSFTVSGVFRDMADFCVLVLYDADNTFEHYSIRYLPDFELAGLTLSFDLTYQGLQPIDSAKYSWIDWSQMDLVTVDRVTGADTPNPPRIRLWDYATLKSSNYSVAQGSYTFTASGGCQAGDSLVLFVNNVGFTVSAAGGESGDAIAAALASAINGRDWSNFQDTNAAVIASTSGSGQLTLKNARTGQVSVSGTIVTWSSGTKFPGIAAGSTVYLGGEQHTVQSVTSPTTLQLMEPTTNSPSGAVSYLAEYGGVDGNSVSSYILMNPANAKLQVDKTNLTLAGGNSDNVTWHIDLDFSGLSKAGLSVDFVRQAWLTFAPQLTTGSDYTDTEWSATFENWIVGGDSSVRLLSFAGSDSVRMGNDDGSACTYTGSGWQSVAANNYWHGFGRKTAQPGDAVTITYNCGATHDVYVGTSLANDKGIVNTTLDGAAAATLDCYLGVAAELVARRVIARNVLAGQHTVTIQLNQLKAAAGATVPNGAGFLFDYLEAVSVGAPRTAVVTYPNVSPALDYDTDATYKVSPQRLLWHLGWLGFQGQINHYIGVFWWNQRRRVDAIWNSHVITFAGQWQAGDTPSLWFDLDPSNASGRPLRKTVTAWDTVDTIAEHFVYYINAGNIILRAEKTGLGQITLYNRTPNWKIQTFSSAANSERGTIQAAGQRFTQSSNSTAPDPDGILAYGADGIWQVDTAKAAPLNRAAQEWHADFFAEVSRRGLAATAAFSMELVNPPNDDDTLPNAWRARFFDRTPVETDTGFANLKSSQCAPGPNLTAFQAAAYRSVAELQAAAGLTPWLQFGEFLWWFFSSFSGTICGPLASQPIGYCSYTDPISIGVAAPHDLETGDQVMISGVLGCDAANGTWTVTVTNSTHFTIPASANGAWTTGTGMMQVTSRASSNSGGGSTGPLRIRLTQAHGFTSGDRVIVSGVRSCPEANGTWPVTVVDETAFTIPVSAGTGEVANTGTVRGGSMALYDAATQQAAITRLNRPLYKFTCQDDDPTVNGGADSLLLADLLKAHVDGIRNAVLASYPNARFEILFPNDVNNPVCLLGPNVQYPQGGRLNAAMNLPATWRTKQGSGLDRFKVEALSWGATYLNLTLAERAITSALTAPFSWSADDVAYLVPWFNGVCPWRHEFHTASTRGLGLINFWAYDHLALMSWPLPLMPPVRKAFRRN